MPSRSCAVTFCNMRPSIGGSSSTSGCGTNGPVVGVVASHLRVYRSFTEARAFVQKLGLRNQVEWEQYCRGELPDKAPKPDDIPATPKRTYNNKGWAGIRDWLGVGL